MTAARSRRPTPERLRILETKHDELDKTVTEIHLGVSEMRGQLGVLVTHVLADRKEGHITERTRIGSRAGIIKAIGAALALIIAALLGRGAL